MTACSTLPFTADDSRLPHSSPRTERLLIVYL